jgi:hypothetical protein
MGLSDLYIYIYIERERERKRERPIVRTIFHEMSLPIRNILPFIRLLIKKLI